MNKIVVGGWQGVIILATPAQVVSIPIFDTQTIFQLQIAIALQRKHLERPFSPVFKLCVKVSIVFCHPFFW